MCEFEVSTSGVNLIIKYLRLRLNLKMGYEVDFIGVGQESKSGDAVALRWGNLYGDRSEQKVVIIDGGFRESGQDLVNHIKKYFNTDYINAVISTHPDQDHISGLHVVLDQLNIEQLWIHKPWEHNKGLAKKFYDGRVTDFSLGKRLRASLESACELVDKAKSKKIPILEPFAGLSLYNQNEFSVIGPTKHYYESLIPLFDGMPRAKKTIDTTIVNILENAIRNMKKFTPTWGIDDLDDEDLTSVKNNSSAITVLNFGGHLLMFTGDAGITALSRAADWLTFLLQSAELRFIQIPHHGSRRNVGPTILDQLIGSSVTKGEKRNLTAIASTSKKGEPKHPRKAVMNAFTHRGVSAHATRGNTITFFHDTPMRHGWNFVPPDDYFWYYNDEE